MHVRLTHIDGKLPNLALMKLAAYWRGRGATIWFNKSVERSVFEPQYDRVYGSAIFSSSIGRVESLRREFPGAIVGGTFDMVNHQTIEEHLGEELGEVYDYSIYPGFESSIGFSQRGCRLKCGFCVVPRKEGRPVAVNTIGAIWRGEPYPKHIHLLDNDFFGSPDWRERTQEIIDGGYRVCFNQGINTRLIDDDAAEALVFGSRGRTLPLGGCNLPIERRTLGEFQRWVIRKAYHFIPFEQYDVNAKGRKDTRQLSLEVAP